MSRTDRASRIIAVPLQRAFRALVDPTALSAWLPPNGMSGSFERFDARPGGSYHADAATAAGKATNDTDIVEARFIEIVPDVRVVQVIEFVSDDPAYAGTMTMTWEVAGESRGIPEGVKAGGRTGTYPIRPASSRSGSTANLDWPELLNPTSHSPR